LYDEEEEKASAIPQSLDYRLKPNPNEYYAV